MIAEEELQRLDEERERTALARRYSAFQQAPLFRVAEMLGQSPTAFGTGPILLMMKVAIEDGVLVTAEDVKTVRYGDETMPRRNWATALVDRSAVRSWLREHGTHAMKHSPGAEWCAPDVA